MFCFQAVRTSLARSLVALNKEKFVGGPLKMAQLARPFTVSSVLCANEPADVPYASNHKGLMEFFDDRKNWGELEVKSGRPWKMDELRIKSNEDLHKLWFVLCKERNMLMTMMLAHERECETMPNPERLDKVEESMKNLEDVVRERNQAYWDLEVGYGTTGERPSVFRRDQFGRYRWHKTIEHLIPYRLNAKFRFFNAPGHGDSVKYFQHWYQSKEWGIRRRKILRQIDHVHQIKRRFPDVDQDYLQELYPDVPVKNMEQRVPHLDTYQEKKFIRRGRKIS